MYDTDGNIYEIGKILQRIEKQNKQIIDLITKIVDVKTCTSLTINCDSTEFVEKLKEELNEKATNLNYNN